MYQSFTHVDVRAGRSRWDSRSGKEVVVSGWPGYEEQDNTPGDAYQEGVDWCRAQGILLGNAEGDLMLSAPVTREQMCTFLYRFAKVMGKA